MSRSRMRRRAVLGAVSMRASGTRSLTARCAAGKGQQRDVTRALDRHAEPTLMARTNARHAARQNLAALLHELRKNIRALVVDHVHLLDTELADFLFAEVLTLAARTSARTTGASRAAFAPRTTGTAFAPRTTGTTFATWAGMATWAAVTSAWAMTSARSMSAAFTLWGAGGSLRLRWFLFVCHNLFCLSLFSGRSKLRHYKDFCSKRAGIRSTTTKPSKTFSWRLRTAPRAAAAWCGADDARHGLRVCRRVSSGASNLHRDGSSGT